MSEPTLAEKARDKYTMGSSAYLCIELEKRCDKDVTGIPAGETVESCRELIDAHLEGLRSMAGRWKGRATLIVQLKMLQNRYDPSCRDLNKLDSERLKEGVLF